MRSATPLVFAGAVGAFLSGCARVGLGFAQTITFRAGDQEIVQVEFLQMLPYVLTIVALAGFSDRIIVSAAISKHTGKNNLQICEFL